MSRGALAISRRPRSVSGVLVSAAALSTALHTGLAILIGTVGISGLGSSRAGFQGLAGSSLSDSAFAELAWIEPPPQPDDPPASEPAAPPPKPVIPTPPPEPVEVPQLRLGLANSPHTTDNWIGDLIARPHSGLQSTIEQPELSLNPGAPGSPMATPGQPLAAAAAGERSESSQINTASPPVSEAPGDADRFTPGARLGTSPSGNDPEQRTSTSPLQPDPAALVDAQPRRGQPDGQQAESTTIPDTLGVILPEPTPLDDLGAWDALLSPPRLGAADGAPQGELSTDRPSRRPDLQAAAEARPKPSPAPSSLAPAQGVDVRPQSSSLAAPGIPGPRGEGGTSPGQQSERESDPSAINPDPEVRPGMPWAGEGLEVFTRRIELSLFSRSTRAFRSPLLRVTFDRSGVVTHIEVLESSGSPDVDDSTKNSVYKWTARGKQLEDLAQGSGLSMNFRILLRGR